MPRSSEEYSVKVIVFGIGTVCLNAEFGFIVTPGRDNVGDLRMNQLDERSSEAGTV